MNGAASVPGMSEQQRKKNNTCPTAVVAPMTLNWGALAWFYSGTPRLRLSLPFLAQVTSVLPLANARGPFQRPLSRTNHAVVWFNNSILRMLFNC